MKEPKSAFQGVSRFAMSSYTVLSRVAQSSRRILWEAFDADPVVGPIVSSEVHILWTRGMARKTKTDVHVDGRYHGAFPYNSSKNPRANPVNPRMSRKDLLRKVCASPVQAIIARSFGWRESCSKRFSA